MRIKIQNWLPPTDLAELPKRGEGGEGIVYDLGSRHLLKVYGEITRFRQEKVLDLCSRYETFKARFDMAQFAFPEKVAVNIDAQDDIVGFSMSDIGKCAQLDYLFWSGSGFREKNGQSLTWQEAVDLVYKLYTALDRLHRARIVIGDLNPSNILYDFSTKNPAFIDMDSVQIGQYGCAVTGAEGRYLDPLVEERGLDGNGCYKYTEGSDYYALAVIACEMLTGGDPFEFRTAPPCDAAERRKNRHCLLGYVEDGNFSETTGARLLDKPANKLKVERFQELRRTDPVLYAYLADVLVRGARDSLLYRLPKTDPRHPEYTMRRKGVRTIVEVQPQDAGPSGNPFSPLTDTSISVDAQEKLWSILQKQNRAVRLRSMTTGDPPAFRQFIANFGFDYVDILSGGKSHV
ncbi:hypothetical protein [Mailhella massiliensis]|uniref:Protein kinase domain-containing protein n=1 Tax=Mailhella massiliensis TaxID=1903261 RepID=A0A921DSL6_9BACT|nr:hypothetical protein [Mailhella massiliensis]HJD98283.1 hypothetical protein [Mailhella massiliensis]